MHEAIDELYLESRKAVDEEIDQVEELIMENAVKQGKDADEIEITNLLHDLAIWEKKQKQMKEVETSKKQAKREMLDALNQNAKEQEARKQRKLQDMLEKQIEDEDSNEDSEDRE